MKSETLSKEDWEAKKKRDLQELLEAQRRLFQRSSVPARSPSLLVTLRDYITEIFDLR